MSLLNADQQAAADALFAAMMQPGSEYLISGPAGVGKTYLVRHLADNLLSQHTKAMKLMGLPTRYDEVVLTATTNKAAEALAEATGMPVQTIHSFLHLRVSDDYETGTSSIKKTKAWEVYSNKIVVIDEAYLIDPVVQGFIQQALHNCLVIYVGDHCQLPPVMEAVSPIQKRRIAYSALTQPVRNADQPELQELCQVLRTAVETGQLPSIFPLHKTVIRHLDDAGLQAALTAEFSQEGNTRVLAYTNKRVQDFNQYIRENIQGKTERFSVGETYVSNTAIFADTRPVFATEECVLLEEVRAAQEYALPDGTILWVYPALARSRTGALHEIRLPADDTHVTQLTKHYASVKDWRSYFFLKNTFPNLRPRYASTVHKAQGSTFDKVIIDLSDLGRCTSKNLILRLLYVAVSRARAEVMFYGNLPERAFQNL